MKKRAVAYCRVSTEKEEQLHSLKAQQEFFEKYCKDNNYELIEIYSDEGISGKQMKKRKEFLRMIKDSEKDKYDLVLCKDVFRYARNTEEFLSSIRKIKSLGKNIYFVNHNLDIQEGSEFYLTILSAMSQEESATKSKSIKFGKNITASKGRVPNFVFGYDRIDNYTLKPNPEESKIVKKIFDLYINDEYGCARIAKYLNDNNILTKKSKVGKKRIAKWSQKTVSDLLKNKLYIGYVINNKTEVVDFITERRVENSEDKWNIIYKPEFAIIDENIFYKAENIFKKRSKFTSKIRVSNNHIFSNLIKCSECGFSFRRVKRQYAPNKPIYIWWTCSHRNAYGVNSCRNKIIIHEDELLNIILKYLNSLFKNKEKTIESISKRIKDIINEENKEIKNNAKNIQNEYNNLNNSKKNRMLMFDEGIITLDELHEEINEITNKMNKLQLSLDRIKVDEIDAVSIINNYFNNLDFILNKEDITNKMLKDIISSIVISPENEIKIYLKIANKNYENVEISLNKIIPNTNIGTYRGNKMEWFSKLFLQFI